MNFAAKTEARSTKTLTENLGRAIADLDLLNQNTEKDFLKIGGQLGGFIEAVNLISSRLTALVDLISGGDGINTARSLQMAFDCFTEMRSHYKDRHEELDGMRQEAGRLRHTLAGFEEIVSELNAIGILTRIEIARLGNNATDFGSLASEMKLLTGSVQLKVKKAVETGVLLISPIENAMESIAALDERQVRDLSVAFDNLSSFQDIQSRARDSSARLKARCEEISNAFRKLIVSIQFHDMTRQLVEHVIGVLRRLCSESEDANGRSADARRVTAAVLALQSSQLDDAAMKFASSVGSIVHFLGEVAFLIGEMVDESQTLSGGSKDGENTYFLQMERGCTSILDNIRLLADADSETMLTGVRMEENIGRMRGSIEEIRIIETQMKYMAMNAAIVATHIGEAGDTINVLARSVSGKAEASRERSESIFRVLSSLTETAGRLFGLNELTATAGRGTHNESEQGMLMAVAELHTSGERSIARIAGIIGSGTHLRDELSTARRNFSVGAVFAAAIESARGTLGNVGDTVQAGLAQDSSQPLAGALKDYATHYTMQSERDVHERVTGVPVTGKLAALVSEQPEPPPADADTFGENVDFF